MKLPNADRAVVGMLKLADYCLSPTHPRGPHKPRVFAAPLGLSADQADLLRDALPAAVLSDEATPSDPDEFGRRYVVVFTMNGPSGLGRVRSTWIIRTGENVPRLTSGYMI